MTRLRLAFLGTPDFALPCLEALSAAGHDIAQVYSQPPRPAGRGHRAKPSPVQALAEAQGWPLRTPVSLKDPTEEAAFAALNLDVAVVVAYGLILPASMLAAPRLGCLNLHASLLPRWRGAAPIQRAILAGDRETGVTIMKVDQGLDTGPILLQNAVPLGPRSTAQELHDDLASLGADLMVQALEGLDQGQLAPRPQPDQGVTYAAKLGRTESRLDWRQSAAGPKGPETIKVLAVEVLPLGADAGPGTLLDDRLTIACGDGALRLLRVQRPGKAPLDAAAFLRGFPLGPGVRLPMVDDGP
jgi:methionyl-tRNA formyltransferase